MATNLFVRDMDLGVPSAHDNRRLEVVADGATVACSLLWTAKRREELPIGMVWRARRKKESLNSYIHAVGRAWWFWLGRWSQEARTFVAASDAWRLRWFSIFSCADAWAFVVSMLELRGSQGVDGHTLPDHEVERDQTTQGSAGEFS